MGLFAEKGKTVFVFDNIIDNSFAQYFESKNDKIKFKRIDSGFEEADSKDSEAITKLFREAIGKEDLSISFTELGENGAAALISLPEEGRRFADMMRMYSINSGNEAFDMPKNEVLSINRENPIIKKLENSELAEENAKDIAKHIYLSAVLLSRTLTSEEAKEFIKLNNKLL